MIFRPEQLGDVRLILDLNPFAYWLELIREPLIGNVPALSTWLVCIGMAIVGWSAALAITYSKRYRLAYWIN